MRFWTHISEIRCLDKDEGVMTKNNIRFPKGKCREILNNIDTHYIPPLRRAIPGILNNINPTDHLDFMTHIICKGLNFYKSAIEMPDICLYLCDNFYPIHTWLAGSVSGSQ